MRHIDQIGSLIHTLRQSSSFHALVVQSPPGWAKSATIESALKSVEVPFHSLGSFSTPLSLFNAICDFSNSILVLDDCAGLFEDVVAMSVLKAATWPSVGSDGQRRVTWNSTSEKVRKTSVIFSGKFILLCNSLAAGREMEAFLSRTLYLSLQFSPEEVAGMLMEAAKGSDYYDDTVLSTKVAGYLASMIGQRDFRRINLRTLRMCYEVAKANPVGWEGLIDLLIPRVSAKELVKELSRIPTSAEDQVRQFQRITGLCRRTFYNYRRRLKEGSTKDADCSPPQDSATCTGTQTFTPESEEDLVASFTD